MHRLTKRRAGTDNQRISPSLAWTGKTEPSEVDGPFDF